MVGPHINQRCFRRRPSSIRRKFVPTGQNFVCPGNCYDFAAAIGARWASALSSWRYVVSIGGSRMGCWHFPAQLIDMMETRLIVLMNARQ